jgi:hypothetical protein
VIIADDLAFALDPVAFAIAAEIEPDLWQADLLRKQPRRALLCCSRQSGKTTVTSLIALHTAAYTPDALVVIVAPAQRQSGEMLRQIRKLHAKVGTLPELNGDSVLRIELANGSRILALPGDGGGKTIRGLANARLVVVDEAARVDNELLAAVRPMLATNHNGAMLALSTPAGRRGWFFETWHNGSPWERVRVPASDCPRITKDFLAEELRELGAARFSEEYELAFIDNETSAFNSTVIEAIIDPEVKPLWV